MRVKVLLAAMLAGLLACIPAVAHAAKAGETADKPSSRQEPGGHAEHPPHTIHGKSPVSYFGGPETAFLYIDPKLFFFTIAVFLVLFVVLSKFAWKPILASLEQREKRIADSVALAEQARAEAKELLAQQDAELARAHDQAKQMLEEARAEATKQGEALLTQTREESAKSQKEATDQIASARQEALASLRASAADLASGMVRQISGKTVSAEGYRSFTREEQ